MRNRKLFLYLALFPLVAPALFCFLNAAERGEALRQESSGAGELVVLDDQGRPGPSCPLRNTAVEAKISGFLARVKVVQRFQNPFDEPIEAVYTFPLPAESAVDDMTIRIGERTVRGLIKRRDEARKIYEDARNAGKTAALLDQERPNIFTQAVTNIPPGEEILVEISYVERLAYDEGSYEFGFPMVVGPRYIPGAATGKQGGGWAPDTDQVPDASRITPPVTPPGTRAGHDISIDVSIDAGLPIQAVRSPTHDVLIDRPANSTAAVRLTRKSVVPNKDFLLRYDVAGKQIEDAVLSHHSSDGGYFTMILQPPKRVTVEDVTPKELVFVLDTSGSMSGFPIEKAKETMKLALEGLYPRDTFNLITFAGETKVLFREPVPATAANLDHAQRFLESRQGGGGTEMMTAIRTALSPSDSQEHVRIVCFMTDGYVGNDMAILDEIQKHPNARVFSFGIGSSVNRFLLGKMAELSRGEAEFVGLQDDGSAAARRFHERIRNPLLTDIALDFGDLPVADVYPKRIPDLFSAKPVVVTGRYAAPVRGRIKLTGKMSGRPFERSVEVDFSGRAEDHPVVATLWARTKIDALMQRDFAGIQNGAAEPEIEREITALGLRYRLMTQFTSFVAVEERTVTAGGRPRVVQVPVEMPAGVSYEGVFGDRQERDVAQVVAKSRRQLAPSIGLSAVNRVDAPPAPRPAGAVEGRINREPTDQKELEAAAALEKLDATLRALIGQSGRKVTVEVWLSEPSAAALEALRKLGFEVSKGTLVSKILIGKIPVENLQQLSRLEQVRFVKAR